MHIRHAQKHQPWTVPYSGSVQRARRTGVDHIFGSHTVLHATKTVGKLASVFESLDHTDEPITADQEAVVRDMAADLMTAAMRLANLYGFDLETELVRRVTEKNGTGFNPAEANP